MSICCRYCSVAARAAIIAGAEPAWLTRHPRAVYVRAGYLSVLPWMDRRELRRMDWYRLAWSAVMRTEYVWDHRIPLNHPLVCGLTVPENLRLAPRAVNARKGGSWTETQLSLLEQ